MAETRPVPADAFCLGGQSAFEASDGCKVSTRRLLHEREHVVSDDPGCDVDAMYRGAQAGSYHDRNSDRCDRHTARGSASAGSNRSSERHAYATKIDTEIVKIPKITQQIMNMHVEHIINKVGDSSLRPGQASDAVATQWPAVVAAAIGPSSHHPKLSRSGCQGTCVMSESLATVPCGECAGALYRRSTVSGSRRGAFTSCRCGCWTAGRTNTGGDGFCHCRQPHAFLLCASAVTQKPVLLIMDWAACVESPCCAASVACWKYPVWLFTSLVLSYRLHSSCWNSYHV